MMRSADMQRAEQVQGILHRGYPNVYWAACCSTQDGTVYFWSPTLTGHELCWLIKVKHWDDLEEQVANGARELMKLVGTASEQVLETAKDRLETD